MVLDDCSCVLCNQNCEETCFHLFFECPFSRDCWAVLSINWNLNLSPLDMVLHARIDFNNQVFREVVITACWTIWKIINSVIFDKRQVNIFMWKKQFKEEFSLVCTKASQSKQAAFIFWRDGVFV